MFTFTAYRKIKSKKNLTWLMNISQQVLVSVFLSTQVYVFLYNVVVIIVEPDSTDIHSSKLSTDLSITANAIYCLIAVGLITYYKDIYFGFVLIIIEIGYISTKDTISESEFITGVVICSFIAMSLLIIILKYRYQTLGYELDTDVENIMLSYNQNKTEEEEKHKKEVLIVKE